MTHQERHAAAMKRRELTDEEKAVIEKLYEKKKSLDNTIGYVTTTMDVPLGSKDDKGPWGENPDRVVPAGTTLKIVMVSRMGDCGLTDDLKATHGYAVRLDWESAAMTNIRLTP